MQVDALGKLPGLLFLAGSGTVAASTLLPWRQATTPIISEPGGQFLAGFALVVGGFVGLAMLIRNSGRLGFRRASARWGRLNWGVTERAQLRTSASTRRRTQKEFLDPKRREKGSTSGG